MGLLLIYFLNSDLNVIRTKKTTFAQNSIMAETLHLIQGSSNSIKLEGATKILENIDMYFNINYVLFNN